MPIPYSKPASGRVTGGAEMTERRQPLVDHNNNTHNNNNGDPLKMTMESDVMKCPSRVISCLLNGIIDGNETYFAHAGETSTRNYNLPDAIEACELSFSEVDFMLTAGSLKETLPKLIKLAVRNPLFRSEPRLVFILISCVRTVLIVFDRKHQSLTLFDAHHHAYSDRKKIQKHGALIGTCRYSNLNSFVQWIQNCVFPDSKNQEALFETSLIRITEVGTNKAKGACKYLEKWPAAIQAPVFQTRSSLENKENKNVKSDCPVLRKILSEPLAPGTKRRHDSINGGKSGSAGLIKKQRK